MDQNIHQNPPFKKVSSQPPVSRLLLCLLLEVQNMNFISILLQTSETLYANSLLNLTGLCVPVSVWQAYLTAHFIPNNRAPLWHVTA